MKHLYLIWIVIVLLGVACVVSLIQVQDVQHHQNDGIQAIMCHAETFVRRTPISKTFTLQEKRKAIRFYEQSLSLAHLAPCDS